MSQPPPDAPGSSASASDVPNDPPYPTQPGSAASANDPSGYDQATPGQPYDQQAPPGYPDQHGYPPQQGGYPQQGLPPQQGGYPQQGFPPQPGGYPPQQGGYPAQQSYPQQPYGQPGYPAGGAPVTESDEKLWGLLSHISIPFFGFVGPLIVYLVYKDRSPWLKDTSVEALNFSILYTIAQVVSSVLASVLIGFILLPLVFIGGLVLCILAAMAANRHEFYRYPVNWRLIK